MCVFAGKLCIDVTPQSKIAWISESLCIGCGICVKVIIPEVRFLTVCFVTEYKSSVFFPLL